jgi:hypothetical protein
VWLANAIAYVFVIAVVVAWVIMLRRFGLRWWTVLLSVIVVLFLFGSFFRAG